MGFMDRLNQAVSAVAGPASDFIGSVFDVARMGEHVTDAAVSGIKSLVATEVTGTPHVYKPVSGLQTAGDAANIPLEYLVDRPIQTPANVIRQNIENGDTGISAFLPHSVGQIGQGYEEGAHQSAGQALGYLANSGPTGVAASGAIGAGLLGPIGALPSAGGALTALHNGSLSQDVLGESAAGRAKLRNTDIAFNVTSGTTDFFKALVLDPLNLVSLGGKTALAARKLPYTTRNMMKLADALSGRGDGRMADTIKFANNALDNVRFEAVRKHGLDGSLADTEVIDVGPVKKGAQTPTGGDSEIVSGPDNQITSAHPKSTIDRFETDAEGNTVAVQTAPEQATDYVDVGSHTYHVQTADLGASTIMEAIPAIKASNKPLELATALAETFRIDDDALRHQAYNDIWASAAGDLTALQRLKSASAAAAAAMDRASMRFNEGEYTGEAFPEGAVAAITTGKVGSDQSTSIAHALEKLKLDWVQAIHGDDLAKISDTLDTLHNDVGGSMHSAPLVDWRAAEKYVTGSRLNPLTKVKINRDIGSLAVDVPGQRLVQDSPALPGVTMLAPIVPRLNRLSRILNAVPHEMANKVPHGLVDLTDDVAGYNEVGNMLNYAGVHPTEVARTQSAMAAARSTDAKIAVVKHAERLAVEGLAQRHGLSIEDADLILEQMRNVVSAHTEKLYSAAKDASGHSIQFTHDVDGHLLGAPNLETQQLNTVLTADLPMVDKEFRRVGSQFNAEKAWTRKAHELGLADAAYKLSDQTEELLLHRFNKLWKFQVLFRLGYPVRNMIDNDVRMWATLGGKLTMQAIYNRLQVLGTGLKRANSASAIADRMSADEAARHELLARQDAGTITDAERGLLKDINRKLASPNSYYKLPGVQGERITVNGVTAPAPFEGIEGESFRQQNMGRRYTSQVNSMSSAIYKTMDTHGSFGLVKGTDRNYFDEYAKVLNNQIAQDPAMQQILVKGKTQAQLRRWFGSAEGKRYLRNTGHERANLDEYAANLYTHAMHYTPGPLRSVMRHSQSVTPNQLKEMFPDAASRPDIHGQQWDILKGRGTAKTRKSLLDTAMAVIGDMPDDLLSRHPMFAAVYQDEMRRQLTLAGRDAKDLLDGEDIARMATQARTRALRTVRNTLYDSDTYTNAARMTRFLSPFFAAWQEGMHRWGQILQENPHPLWKAYQVWNSPNKAGIVVDQDGNPVKGPDSITANDMLILKVPNYIAVHHKGWWDKSAKLYTGPQARINKSAFNLWLQGDPFYSPGVGPLVQIPMAEVVKHVPTLNDAYTTFIDGYGVPQNWYDPLESATGKRIVSAVRGPDDQAFAQAFSLRFQDNMVAMNRGEIPHMSADDLTQKTLSETRRLFMLRALSNSTLPFPPTPNSKFQFFRDQFAQLQAEQRADHPDDYEWATRQFLMDYGDVFFPLTQSVSKNNAGVQATAGAVMSAQKYSSIIGKMRDPKMAASIIGSAGQSGDFNMAAYRAQQSMKIQAGATGKDNRYRSKMDPAEAASNLQIEQGWYRYNQAVADLNAEAVSRGGADATYKDYDDLVLAKRTIVEALSKDANGDNNPWYEDYMGFNESKYGGDVVHDMREVVKDPSMKNRTDVKLLGRYLQVRDSFAADLAARKAAGGSGVMTSQSNADLALAYRTIIGALVNSNTEFNTNWYQRWIERDPYYVPTGGE